ncbi:hypothetical protein JCM5353_000602 [Sporobolomyces roseus]
MRSGVELKNSSSPPSSQLHSLSLGLDPLFSKPSPKSAGSASLPSAPLGLNRSASWESDDKRGRSGTKKLLGLTKLEVDEGPFSDPLRSPSIGARERKLGTIPYLCLRLQIATMHEGIRLCRPRQCHTHQALPWEYTFLRPADKDTRSLLLLTHPQQPRTLTPNYLEEEEAPRPVTTQPRANADRAMNMQALRKADIILARGHMRTGHAGSPGFSSTLAFLRRSPQAFLSSFLRLVD